MKLFIFFFIFGCNQETAQTPNDNVSYVTRTTDTTGPSNKTDTTSALHETKQDSSSISSVGAPTDPNICAKQITQIFPYSKDIKPDYQKSISVDSTLLDSSLNSGDKNNALEYLKIIYSQLIAGSGENNVIFNALSNLNGFAIMSTISEKILTSEPFPINQNDCAKKIQSVLGNNIFDQLYFAYSTKIKKEIIETNGQLGSNKSSSNSKKSGSSISADISTITGYSVSGVSALLMLGGFGYFGHLYHGNKALAADDAKLKALFDKVIAAKGIITEELWSEMQSTYLSKNAHSLHTESLNKLKSTSIYAVDGLDGSRTTNSEDIGKMSEKYIGDLESLNTSRSTKGKIGIGAGFSALAGILGGVLISDFALTDSANETTEIIRRKYLKFSENEN